jgi:hypothetical protein
MADVSAGMVVIVAGVMPTAMAAVTTMSAAKITSIGGPVSAVSTAVPVAAAMVTTVPVM